MGRGHRREGPQPPPRPRRPTKPAADYSNDELKFIYRHFLGPDPLIEPRTFRTGEDDGERVLRGRGRTPSPPRWAAGGTHADGKVPRFREEDFRAVVSTHGPIDGADVADWPSSYDDLEPYYAEAERMVGVAGDAGANPFAAWRSGPYPMPSGAPMYGAVLSSAAAERVGPASLRGAHGRQLGSLRRAPGVQQLRLLRLLRLSHPRQG